MNLLWQWINSWKAQASERVCVSYEDKLCWPFQLFNEILNELTCISNEHIHNGHLKDIKAQTLDK